MPERAIKSKMTKGHKTRTKILKYLHKYHDEHGYMPSYREIGKAIGISSTSTIFSHMQKLIETGILQTEHPGNPRAFRFGENDI